MIFEPRRMHPVAGFLSFLKQLKELILPFIFLFFVGPGDDFETYFLLGACVVVFLLLVFGILHWYRYTYRIESGELRIEYGVFVRKNALFQLSEFKRLMFLRVSFNGFLDW